MTEQTTLLENDIARLSENIAEQYAIDAHYFEDQSIKRGLRNADGTGVLIGVSKVGSVQGYYMMDGERVPMPGKLYYRGISVEDIVTAHQQNGTFGYEEVAYLLLLGKLPTRAQLQRFNDVMAQARRMPAAFTEDMILKAPSRTIMNPQRAGPVFLRRERGRYLARKRPAAVHRPHRPLPADRGERLRRQAALL